MHHVWHSFVDELLRHANSTTVSGVIRSASVAACSKAGFVPSFHEVAQQLVSQSLVAAISYRVDGVLVHLVRFRQRNV